MGWLFLFVFAGLTFAALWRTKLLDRTALEITAVVILVGLAGYAWQGSPNLRGVSATTISPTG